MEAASTEKLTSVSNLVTAFENSRYGVVGVGRTTEANQLPLFSPLPTLGPWEAQAEERDQGHPGPAGSSPLSGPHPGHPS